MTCIIGLKHNGDVYLCSDSAINIGNGVIAQVGSKMLKSDTCLVGISGPRSVFNLLAEREHLFAGNFNPTHLNRIWDCLKTLTPINTESELLIAVNSQLFWIGNIAGWRVVSEEFECIGSGAQVAKGAMAMSQGFFETPGDRLFETMDIVSNYCVGIAGPFDLECVVGEDE